MKKFLDSNLMTIPLGISLLIMWFIGKDNSSSETNKQLLLMFGAGFPVIGLLSIFLENFLKKNPIKKVGYVNKNDEFSVMIRDKARSSVYHVMFLGSYLLLGLTFSGILPFDKLSSNFPLYLAIGIPLLDVIFTGYYASKPQ